ncbi:MAG: YihY/virulence factor BrkB family protein [Desulfovibrionales bacterium]|nr:YihY/virulence factor BrkB family protein [Desulfovibrionales bacterium]
MAMPNARVRLKPAVIAGIISGTMFQLMQWAYIVLQMGAVKYNAVYGSFAALPLFLIWLQASWMIVLFGSELSFAYTNVRRYIFATEVKNISQEYKSKISLAVMRLIIKNFMSDGQAATPEEIQQELGLPILLVQHITNDLLEADLIVQLSNTGEDSEHYHPGKDINIMTISFILKELQKSGYSDIPINHDAAWKKISKTLDHFEEVIDKSSENVLLKDVT